MRTSSFPIIRLVACLSLTACYVWGQDPFAPAPADVPAAPKVGGRKGAVPAGPPPSPAAAAILAGNPSDVAGLVSAIDTLDRLDEVERAKPLLQQLLAMQPDDAKLAAAVEKLGSPVFFRLAKIESLQPQGAEIADRALAAAGKVARDPARLISQAQALAAATTESAQGPALSALLTAGSDGAAAIVGELRDDKLSVEGRARLIATLREIGSGAVDPLLAALRSPSAAQRAAAIELLPTLGGDAALVGLLAPALAGNDATPTAEQKSAQAELQAAYGRVPSRAEAATMLKREAAAWLNDDRRPIFDAQGKTLVWDWDAKAQRPVSRLVDRRAAQALRGMYWADDAIRLTPEDSAARRLWLNAHLRTSAWEHGFDAPLAWSPDEMKTVEAWGAATVEDQLASSLKSGDQLGAAGAARLLAKTGLATSLKGPKFHPLVDAVRSIDPRVRFAAVETLLTMNPHEPFLGSGFLVEAIAHFAGMRGQPMAAVGFRSEPVATQLAGFYAPLGIEAVPTTTGRGLVRAAQKLPDAEMIMVSSWIDHDPLSLTIQELRRDVRTAALPIVILYEDAAEEPRLLSLYDGQPNVSVYARPYDQESTAFLAEQVRRKQDVAAVPAAERRKQGVFALAAMSRLLDANSKQYDFRAQTPMLIEALNDAWRTADAADVLARIGDHDAQAALTEFASRPEVSAGQRTTAVTALGEAVRRYGVRLTKPEVAAQYARYNASRTAPAETQKILAAILDAIELPTKAAQVAPQPTN